MPSTLNYSLMFHVSGLSSTQSGDVGCAAFRKKSPGSKRKNQSSSSSRRVKVNPPDESTSDPRKRANPSHSTAAVAPDDQEVAAVTRSVKSALSAAPDQLPIHSHTPLGRSKSEQVSSRSPSQGKRSAGRPHHRLDLSRFSVYNQPPGDQKTKYTDLNEIVMKGHSTVWCSIVTWLFPTVLFPLAVKEVTVTGKKEDVRDKSLEAWNIE